jgi:hypothetical protein
MNAVKIRDHRGKSSENQEEKRFFIHSILCKFCACNTVGNMLKTRTVSHWIFLEFSSRIDNPKPMKKTLIFFLLVLAPFAMMAQKSAKQQPLVPPDMPRSEENNQVYYMDVITEDGIDKTELFRRASNWYKKFYKNPSGAMESADSVNSMMVFKPAFSAFRTKDGAKVQSAIVKYTLTLSFKDGKYRYEIKNINLQANSYYPIEKLFNQSDPNIEDNYNTLNEAHNYFTNLIEDLQAGMREPSAKKKKDDW